MHFWVQNWNANKITNPTKYNFGANQPISWVFLKNSQNFTDKSFSALT